MSSPVFVLLLQLLVVIAAARCAGVLFRRFGQTPVIGEMAAGIILGPSFLGRWLPSIEAAVFPPASLAPLQLLSQLGVVLFMFVVGTEVDLERLRHRARAAIVISYAGIAAPFTMRDSSEARNRATLAMSSGWPTANGYCPAMLSMPPKRIWLPPVKRLLTRYVSTMPGQMALTRIPLGE